MKIFLDILFWYMIIAVAQFSFMMLVIFFSHTLSSAEQQQVKDYAKKKTGKKVDGDLYHYLNNIPFWVYLQIALLWPVSIYRLFFYGLISMLCWN